jgi:hypothetical protein
MNSEFVFFNFLVESFFVDNTVISINHEFFNIVRKDSFQGVNLEILTSFGNNISDLIELNYINA